MRRKHDERGQGSYRQQSNRAGQGSSQVPNDQSVTRGDFISFIQGISQSQPAPALFKKYRERPDLFKADMEKYTKVVSATAASWDGELLWRGNGNQKHINISRVLKSFRDIPSSDPKVQSFFQALEPIIAKTDYRLDHQAVGNALGGMREKEPGDPGVAGLMNALTDKIVDFDTSKGRLTGQEVGNGLSGLEEMSSRYDFMRKLLPAMTSIVQRSHCELTAEEMLMAAQGLQNMNSKHEGVNDLVGALADKINPQKIEGLTQEGIHNALTVMQLKDTSNVNIQKMAGKLSQTIANSNIKLSGEQFAVMSKFLRHSSSEHKQVTKLVGALLSKVDHRDHTSTLHSHQIAPAINSMRNMSNRDKNVDQMVEELALVVNRSIKDGRVRLNNDQMAQAFSGLRGMGESSSVNRLVGALDSAIDVGITEDGSAISGHHIADVLDGMQNLRQNNDNVQSIISKLNEKSEHSKKRSGYFLCNILHGLHKKGVKTKGTGVDQIVSSLAQEVTTSDEIAELFYQLVDKKIGSAGVATMMEVISGVLNDKNIQLSGKQIGKAMYGLQNMPHDNPAVQSVLEMMVKQINGLSHLEAGDVGSILSGLVSMDYDEPQVERLLIATAQTFSQSQSTIKAEEAAQILGNMAGMKGKKPAEQKILSTLAEEGKVSWAGLTNKQIGMALYGFSNMQRDTSAVLPLLDKIAEQVEQSTVLLSGQAITNGLAGLSKMDGNQKQVERVIKVMANKIDSQTAFSAQEMCNSLYFLHGMNGDSDAVKTMFRKLDNSTVKGDDPHFHLAGFFSLNYQDERIRDYLPNLRDYYATPPHDLVSVMKESFIKGVDKRIYDKQKRELDLHRLSYPLMELLLDNIDWSGKGDFCPQTIIFGRGLHSRADNNRAKELVVNKATTNDCILDMHSKGGACDLTYSRAVVHSLGKRKKSWEDSVQSEREQKKIKTLNSR